MKLRNKKTGEIYDFKITPDYDDVMSGWKIENKDFGVRYYSHLAELNEEWEDYEEPKEYWCIDWTEFNCGIFKTKVQDERDEFNKEIGNYFETKEEAEKAVEKLKAWKRLKDKGFRFDGWDENHHNLGIIEFSFDKVKNNVWDFDKDLDLLFSGEDD